MATREQPEADARLRRAQIMERIKQLHERRDLLAAPHRETARDASRARERADQALVHATQAHQRAAECHAEAERIHRRVADFLDEHGHPESARAHRAMARREARAEREERHRAATEPTPGQA